MALPLVLPGAPQGHALVKEAVVPDHGSLADDDAHSVVNDQPPPNGRAGVDFDAGAVPGVLGNPAGQEMPVMEVQPVGRPVPKHSVDAWVQKENLQLAPGRGVPALVGGQQAAETSQIHSKFTPCRAGRKQKRLPYRSTRGDESRFHSHLSLKGPLTGAGRRDLPSRSRTHFAAPSAGALAAGDAPSLFFG